MKSVCRFGPTADAWTGAACRPAPVCGPTATGANDRLQLVGGRESDSPDRKVLEFAPVTHVWTSPPDARFTSCASGRGRGTYRIGGLGQPGRVRGGTMSAILPGYDRRKGDDVTWLPENRGRIGPAPGRSVTVELTVDSSVLSGPGDYGPKVAPGTDTPYTDRSIAVAFPRSRGPP
ncbi:hypothetical protein ACIRP2_26195 [Streptomyces sp. NPDC101194]|uniref:hypothetical protein n=1 Tax=Streptomyces sp. NPDC101194 TaxID=3366127 RepID=UPI0037F9A0FC